MFCAIRDPKQARELEELFTRQLTVDGDESDALKLPSLGTISTIASVAGPVISGIIDHFKHKYVPYRTLCSRIMTLIVVI